MEKEGRGFFGNEGRNWQSRRMGREMERLGG